MLLDLTQGLTDNTQYKAWKFAGGELHFQLKHPENFLDGSKIEIQIRVNNSDDLILLLIAVDTVKKTNTSINITVYIPYFCYQQADRDFSFGECFSLKTITNILNTFPVDKYIVFDAHSDVTPALLKNCQVVDNSEFIKFALENIFEDTSR